MCYVALLCCLLHIVYFFFFFKQKTAYEMRISDWSSDVCSSDLTEMLSLSAAAAAMAPGAVLWLDFDTFLADPAAALLRVAGHFEIGRASCRERVCQYV